MMKPRSSITAKHRNLVELRAALGWSEVMCAADLGISRSTFRRHFGTAFRAGRRRKQGEAADLLWEAAKAGNVAAQRAFVALLR